MRFHIVNLPHTQTTRDYGQCAYTQKVRKFCDMMSARGHEVYLYASSENEATCTEKIMVLSKGQIKRIIMGTPDTAWWPNQYYKIPYRDDFPLWEAFNNRAVEELKKRVRKGDYVLLTAGKSQEAIYHAFPYNSIEFAVGYEGIVSKYRVFETYAWLHQVYGLKGMRGGTPTDTVIYNYYDVTEFPFSKEFSNYLLFMSRPVRGKGVNTVIELAKRTGTKVIVAGAEKVEGVNIEWVGYADFKKRGELMRNARALLAPTLGIEPFGGVAAEAQLCGTPVITTDWGAFTETVEQGVTGFRCRSMDEFIKAEQQVGLLNREYIATRARKLFSMETAAKQYEDYFYRIKPYIDKAIIFR